jgi:hypothetical protein
MAVRQPRYPKEEFALRGDEIYNRDIRPQVETDQNSGNGNEDTAHIWSMTG